MPRGLNGTHRELSLSETVVSSIWRPPALAGPWGSSSNGVCGPVRYFSQAIRLPPPARGGRRAAARRVGAASTISICERQHMLKVRRCQSPHPSSCRCTTPTSPY